MFGGGILFTSICSKMLDIAKKVFSLQQLTTTTTNKANKKRITYIFACRWFNGNRYYASNKAAIKTCHKIDRVVNMIHQGNLETTNITCET